MLLAVCYKGFLLLNIKKLNYQISGQIVSISGILPDLENGQISGPTLLYNIESSNPGHTKFVYQAFCSGYW